jgi:DNA-binding transcriptional MocR family regulator
MSCIISHANPKNGICYPRQTTIAIETGYSRDTVMRAVRWWEKQGFLKSESRGRGRALAYHPQWELLESFWIAVTSDIEEQKSLVQHLGCNTRAASRMRHDEQHHGATQNLKVGTLKEESHPERVRPPSVADTNVISLKEKEEGIQRTREEVESLSTNSQPPEGLSDDEAYTVVSGYCREHHWAFLTEEDLDAATRAELRESGSGRAAIDAAFKLRIGKKGAQGA